ncbi:hypothetical protein [Pseudoxanthomonas sp. 10H]|uniref:hypothetical protein n=1 Tax=Pseudoxanthomonas sp. 10H TaxID=3242729 RepID=UPI003558D866
MLRLCAILLSLLPGSQPVGTMDIAKPEPFAFGSPVAEVRQRLAPLCTSLQVRVVTAPPLAPLARISQHRIDCEGFPYAGRPRKVELVFQDNQLDLVWITFPAQEKDAFLRAFNARYGRPSLQVGFGSVYLAAGAAVRNVPTRVMFASPRQARAMATTLRAAGETPPTPSPSKQGETR